VHKGLQAKHYLVKANAQPVSVRCDYVRTTKRPTIGILYRRRFFFVGACVLFVSVLSFPTKQSDGPNLVPCPNMVLSLLELSAHGFQALDSSRHAVEGLPYYPVTNIGSSSAANGRAGEEYQVKARYQVRANPLLILCVLCFSRLDRPRTGST